MNERKIDSTEKICPRSTGILNKKNKKKNLKEMLTDVYRVMDLGRTI